MRPFIAIVALACSVAPALAQGLPSTLSMSCASARALVTNQGAIVLSTGGRTYDRFVSTPGLCDLGLYGVAAFVPTADNEQCYIGFYCSPQTRRLRP